MAQRVVTQLVDDLTGEDISEGGGETIEFALDGQQYSIDLSTKNADKFRGVLQEYIAVASKPGGRRSSVKSNRYQAGPSAREIRDWARSSGYDVPDRGRIPAAVRDAYSAAN